MSVPAKNIVSLKALAAKSLHKAGFARHQIALAIEVSYQVACLYINKHLNTEQTPKLNGLLKAERNQKAADMYRAGNTLEQIGVAFGITRERVRQILKRQGITFADRGVTAKQLDSLERKKERSASGKELRERTARMFYGCSVETLNEINGGKQRSRIGSPAQLFTQQKKNANQRGVEWQLSLPEWWEIWQESGHWERRGKGKESYCMARYGDTGPYSKENVHIVSNLENIQEGYEVVSGKERAAKTANTLSKTQALVAQLLDDGLTQAEICERLQMKRATCWQHIRAVGVKKRLAEVHAKNFAPHLAASTGMNINATTR